MAYRRRRRIRRSRRPRRSARRSRFGSRRFKRSRKFAGQAVHSIKRIGFQNISNSTSTNATYGAISFAMTDIATVAEFTALFEQYRIIGVELKFLPAASSSDVPGSDLGTLMYFKDYDDAISPTTLTDFEQRPDMQTRQLSSKPFKVFIRPAVASGLYTAAGTLAPAGNMRRQWIDTTDTNIPYYGFKYVWLSNSNPVTVTTMRVVKTYYLQLKGIK